MRLTDTALRSLRPGQEVGEQDLRARANGDGTVSLFVRLPRDAGGKRPKLTLGRWPGTKLREARERIRTELAAAAKAPARSASGPTLAEALDDYRRRQLCHRVRWQERYRELEKHLLPALGDRPLTGVSRRDLAALIDALPRRASTNKLQTYMHTFFSWARDAGLIDAHPMAGMKKRFAERPRSRVLSLDELGVLARALPPPGDSAFADIVRLLTLTGQRRGEIASLTWRQIDATSIRWARTKNGDAHAIPLIEPVQAVLDRYRGVDLLFGGFSGWSQCKARLDARSGVRGWALLDLRRTAATHWAATVGPGGGAVIEGLLNHRPGSRTGLSGVYATYQRHRFHDEARDLLQTWAAVLASLRWCF